MDEEKIPAPAKDTTHYKGLASLLYAVRWTQHLLAIVAEVLILLSFAMSGMDVSLGGTMANIPWLKVLWAGMFALGIDTAFALSWVRVRQCANNRQWGAVAWNLLLALSMSLIIFQPIAVQLLQQSLNLNFSQAVDALGINIVLLTYARSAVAIFLGAILAMTNVELETQSAMTHIQPKRQFIRIDQLFRKDEPIKDSNEAMAPVEPVLAIPEATPVVSEDMALPKPSVAVEETITEQITPPEQPAEMPAQPEAPTYDTPEQRAAKVSEIDFTGLSARERVAKVLELFSGLSDRELGKLSSVSAATAKKHRTALRPTQPALLPDQT
jgi:hypothetical protein